MRISIHLLFFASYKFWGVWNSRFALFKSTYNKHLYSVMFIAEIYDNHGERGDRPKY
jgi:hypothetical protein